MKNKEIDYIMFTVKQEKKKIADVIVDLYDREYSITYTDLYGHVMEPERGGRLPRKAVETFLNKLEEIDLVSMPVNKTNTLPINMKDAMITYFLHKESYNTEGPKTGNLSSLHKALEELIGVTFGSYDFYM